MKKITGLLFLLVSEIMVLSSCNNSNESNEESPSTNNISSEEYSSSNNEVSSIEEVSSSEEMSSVIEESSSEYYEQTEEVQLIDAFSEDANIPNRTYNVDNVFSKAKYSYNQKTNDSYDDEDHTKLTDGITTKLFDKQNWAAFYTHEDVVINFEITDSKPHGIGDISLDVLQQVSYAIDYPEYITCEASFDNELYVNVGTVYTPTDLADSSFYSYQFAFKQELTARYYRFTAHLKNHERNRFFFIDEVRAYEYKENGATVLKDEVDLYNYNLNTSTTTTSNNSTDKDYNDYQNLAKLDGVDIQVNHFDGLTKEKVAMNDPADELYKLTDGVKCTSVNTSDSALFRFAYGGGRNVVFDLGNQMAVNKVSGEFLNFFSSGVIIPGAFMISLSEDGSNWTVVNSDYTRMYMNNEKKLWNLDITFDKLYKARYVKITFITNYNLDDGIKVYCSELEVWGYKNLSNANKLEELTTLTSGSYPNPEDCGINNMWFTFLSSTIGLEKDKVLPYLAYIDENGEYVDTFMDTVCLTTNSSIRQYDDLIDNVDAQRDYFFASNGTLDVLEQAMEIVNTKMGTNNKLQVVFGLVVSAGAHDETCKDIDGDGKRENMANKTDAIDVYKYQINKYISAFNSKNYENLTIKGFYWNEEYMHEDYVNYITYDVFKPTNDYIRTLGYVSGWCPFYGAGGIWNAIDTGCDFTCLQPNYMFNAVDASRVENTATIAKMYGMCVEIEIEDVQSKESINKYNVYLKTGITTGYMNSIKMYYQGTWAYYNAYCNNKELYKNTYLYSKGLLTEDFDNQSSIDSISLNDINESMTTNESITFSIGDVSAFDVTFINTPIYGSIKLNNSGELTYTSMYSYVGNETIKLLITDQYGNNKEITVTIKVNKE